MTYYAVLRLPPAATYEQLHARYLQLSREYHPDLNPLGDAEQFKLLTAAWTVLKDAQRRERYDRQLKLDGGNCLACAGRGMRWRRKTGEALCAECGGTGRK
jgi:curved DNA-binding protein CbpA